MRSRRATRLSAGNTGNTDKAIAPPTAVHARLAELVLYRRQHHAVEDSERNWALQTVAVVAGVDHDYEVERGHDIEALAAQADTGRPGDLTAVAERPAEPPLVTVEEQALAVD